MLSTLFHTLLYNPLYNALVFLVSVVPFGDVALAVIVLTLVVKLVLFPLSIKAVKTQMLTKLIEPEVAALKEKYKNDKQEQAKKIMALYKERGVNPFSSIFLLLIQLPIIFALYFVFLRGGLPLVDTSVLYSFVPVPDVVNMSFLGFGDVSERSIILALLAGLTQFFQAKLALPPLKERGEKDSFKEDLARSMHLQMRYVLPVIVAVIAFTISAAIALYWTTSNLFAIGQELYMRKKIRPRYEEKEQKAA